MLDLADEVRYALTDDGFRLALHRHRPDRPRPGALPVLLCHGIATNKMGVDLDAEHSLAVFLKGHGYDVFALSLRGGGLSDRTAPDGSSPGNFDSLVTQDAPAAIDAVLKITKSRSASWVGYSLGGMIGYAVCANPASRVACLVTLGSPGNTDHARGWLLEWSAAHPSLNDWVPLRSLSRRLAPLGGIVHTPVDRLLYDPNNVSRSTIQNLLAFAVEDVHPGLAKQLARWVREERETSDDGSVDYRQSLERIRVPSLFIAGAGDHIAPPEQVRYACEQSRSRQRRFVLAGKNEGFTHDYCHIGLAMGDDAPREIFPLVADWLNGFGTRTPRSKRNEKKRTN